MANNERTHTDGSGVWADNYTTLPTDWQDLERKVFGSWNGDKGGAYRAPAGHRGEPWVFAGDGFQITGPTRLSYGGAIYGGSGAYVIRDGAWPQLQIGHATRTRSIVCPIHSWHITSQFPDILGSWPQRTYLWTRRHPYVGVGSVALACRATTSQTIETAEIYTPLRTIDGSTLEQVTLFFRVASARTLAPIAMPKMRVLRVPRNCGIDSVGGLEDPHVFEPLKDTTDGTGYDFLPLVTSATDWYNDGEVQSFTYECDQNNEIDKENYHYIVQIVEEVGALSAADPFDGVRLVERKQDVTYWCPNSNTLSGDQTVTADGITTGTAGSRILVTDPDTTIDPNIDPIYAGSSAVKNGIWLTAAGAWTRANDLDDTEDFSPNWIVRVTNGGINANSSWQCLHPNNTQRITLSGATGGADATFARARIEPALPKGNIYHCLVPQFALTDLRFQ